MGVALWDLPIASVSPEQVVARIPPTTRVSLLVGTAYSIALEELSQEYYQRLRQARLATTLRELPGKGHEIFLGKAVQ